MSLTNLILIALFAEAIVQQLKPLWDKTAGKITVAEIVTTSLSLFAETSTILLYVLAVPRLSSTRRDLSCARSGADM